MYDRDLLVSELSGFTRTLLRPYDLDVALEDLAERVTDVLRLAGSGVSLVENDRLTYATAVPARVARVEQAQDESQNGPCMRAYRMREVVAVPDLRMHTEEWSAYCAAAQQVGVLAVAGIPMQFEDTMVGALNLYADGVRDWTAADLAVAQVLADMATGYLINASQLSQQQQLNEQLQRALDSRVVIEQAKGVVAATHGTSIDQAFQLIRQHARSHNASLRAVAEAVVHVGLKL